MTRSSTMAKQPPDRVSEEATKRGLELAREQGEALGKTLRYMTGEVADYGGAEKRAGEYLVGWAAEDAEGMYHWRDGALHWEEPGEGEVHLEVSVRDGADGRFVPGLDVRATLIDERGSEVGTHVQPFLWHPWLYHYGRNWRIPGDGRYRLRIHIEPPTYARHDEVNGKRFAEPVDVEFDDVRIDRSQQ